MASTKTYLCYVLASASSRRTYVGITCDMRRRLRQHNGEIVGGARSTHTDRPWRVVCTVNGFPDKRVALQFEWRMHRRNRMRRAGRDPLTARLLFLASVLSMERWTSTAPLRSSLALRLDWLDPTARPLEFSLPPEIIENIQQIAAELPDER